MKTISVCMIVKNEEGVLARCLESVLSFCDELIIVDTGSTDKTISIAKTYTSHVYFFPWCDDFAKARNFSFSKATKEYCMWLDADDIVPVFSQQQLLKWKVATTYPDVVMLPYHIFTPTQEQAICSFYRERLLKRNNHDQWIGEIHEIIIPHGIIEYEEYPIEHHKTKTTDPDRNFHILDNLQKKGKTLSPRQLFYWANELFSHKKYKEAIQAYQKFLKTDGLSMIYLEAKLLVKLLGFCISNNNTIMPFIGTKKLSIHLLKALADSIMSDTMILFLTSRWLCVTIKYNNMS